MPHCRRPLFIASQRSELDLNDLWNTELNYHVTWADHWKPYCMLYFDCVGRSQYPLCPPCKESDTGRGTLGGGFSRMRHSAERQCHTALQFVFPFLWIHLMKTNELSPLLLPPEGMQHHWRQQLLVYCQCC